MEPSDLLGNVKRREVAAPPEALGEEVAAQAVDITVLIPCLNEERSVEDVVRQAFAGLGAAGLRGEVVVVDNASEDGTDVIPRMLDRIGRRAGQEETVAR